MDRGAPFKIKILEMQNVLLSCIADAIEGAQQAYKAGILHRDLSAGNIMIVKDKETQEWRGILIDWDMCLLWRKHGGEPRSGRTGTWAFISARILQNEGPTVRHTLWDDIESAFWVFVYEALLYLKHDELPGSLYEGMQTIFSRNSRLRDGSVIGVIGASPNSRRLVSTNSWTNWVKSSLSVIFRTAGYLSSWMNLMKHGSLSVSGRRP
ncbi:hypothetical protein BYT27DRAFT_6437612 [Phlegmacium glaucopus]|nr:hypothetical protein BYT27DRAFT_6437612 [Phlegmacium glaucopus]